jgi:uncharacterized cupredoxin-like copper-binding protein
MTRVACAVTCVLIASLWAPFASAHEGHHMETGIGAAGKAAAVTKTVEIVMSDDMRFAPSTITVASGQTVRFSVRNAGHLRHEFVIGTDEHLAGHAQAMREHPDMKHAASDNAVSLEAGKRGSVIWRFAGPGAVTFACLEAGHYDAGMKGTITVVAAH